MALLSYAGHAVPLMYWTMGSGQLSSQCPVPPHCVAFPGIAVPDKMSCPGPDFPSALHTGVKVPSGGWSGFDVLGGWCWLFSDALPVRLLEKTWVSSLWNTLYPYLCEENRRNV